MVVCIIHVYRAQYPRIRNTCKCTPSGNKYTHTFTCINVSLCLHEPPDTHCCYYCIHWVVFACFVVVVVCLFYTRVHVYTLLSQWGLDQLWPRGKFWSFHRGKPAARSRYSAMWSCYPVSLIYIVSVELLHNFTMTRPPLPPSCSRWFLNVHKLTGDWFSVSSARPHADLTTLKKGGGRETERDHSLQLTGHWLPISSAGLDTEPTTL